MLIRYADVPDRPWVNGGGLTRPLHAADGWSLSVATIDRVGEFSAFPGLERTFVVAAGRLDLRVADVAHRLTTADVVRFAGEDEVVADPLDGPVTAVNVMTWRSSTALVRVGRWNGGDATALVLLAGALTVGGEVLRPFDAAIGVVGDTVSGDGLSGDGLVAVVQVVVGGVR